MDNNAQACIDAGRRIGELETPRELKVSGVRIPLVVLPQGCKVESLDRYLPYPRRIDRRVRFTEPASFCEYVNQFKIDGHTRLYGGDSDGLRSIQANIDDHAKGSPSWSTHSATLVLSASDEWTAWAEWNKKPMTHRQFAEFLEEHISDIASPSASDLLAVTRRFTISQKVEIASEYTDGGNIEFATVAQVRGAPRHGQAELPRELVLGLRPFEQSDRFEVRALLRFSYSENGVKFSFALVESNLVVENAFLQVRQDVENKTRLPVLV